MVKRVLFVGFEMSPFTSSLHHMKVLDIIKVVYFEGKSMNITCYLCRILLTNVSGRTVAVPVIPVPHKVAEDVLVLEEGEAVLAVPVIGLVPHPVIPRVVSCHVGAGRYKDDLPSNLCACGVPPPVAPVVFAVGPQAGGSDPPLLVPPGQMIVMIVISSFHCM